jgi:Cof subfamily protein (haloacid dehalogenase superfamily)
MKFYYKAPLSRERLDKIKILAFDMDDTLLDARGKLSAGNREALERAMEKGYHVVIASGRVWSALPKDVLAVPGIQYAITSNGARIRDVHAGKVLYEDLLGTEAVEACYPWMKDPEVMLEIFYDDEVVADRWCMEHLEQFGRVTPKAQEYVLTTRTPVDDLWQRIEDNKARIENINLIFGDDEKRRRYLAEIKAQVPLVTAVSSTPVNIELGGVTTSKANALDVLAGMLGCGKENIMAFGDSTNDEQMLRHAGIGVAMGNAVPELLDIADYIAPTHDDDGVAYTLEKLLGI